MVEEGQPDYLEQNINTILRRHDVQARVHGKDVFTMAGEYTCQLMEAGLRKFLQQWEPAAITVPPLEKSNGPESERSGATGAATAVRLVYRLSGAPVFLRRETAGKGIRQAAGEHGYRLSFLCHTCPL